MKTLPGSGRSLAPTVLDTEYLSVYRLLFCFTDGTGWVDGIPTWRAAKAVQETYGDEGRGKERTKREEGGKERINPGFLAGSDQRRESPLLPTLLGAGLLLHGDEGVGTG